MSSPQPSPSRSFKKQLVIHNRHGQTIKIPLRVLSPSQDPPVSNSKFLTHRKSTAPIVFLSNSSRVKTNPNRTTTKSPSQKFLFDSSSLASIDVTNQSFYPNRQSISPGRKSPRMDSTSYYFTEKPQKGVFKADKTHKALNPLFRDISHLKSNNEQFKKKYSEYSLFRSQSKYMSNIVGEKPSVFESKGSLPDLPYTGPEPGDFIGTLSIPLLEMIESGGINQEILKGKEYLEECLNFESKLKKYEVGAKSIAFDNLVILHESLRNFEVSEISEGKQGNYGLLVEGTCEAGVKEISKKINDTVQRLKKLVPNIFQDAPCSRHELDRLLAHLKEELRVMNSSFGQERIEQINVLVTLTMHETFRQILLQSFEKGELLVFVWNMYFSLMAKLLAVSAEKSAHLTKKMVEKITNSEKEFEKFKKSMMALANEKQMEINRLKKLNLELSQRIDVHFEETKITQRQNLLFKKILSQSLVRINLLTAENAKLKQKVKNLKEIARKKEESAKEILKPSKSELSFSEQDPDFEEFDVNYDVNNDPDFKEDFATFGELSRSINQVFENDEGEKIKGIPDMYDKYTELSFEHIKKTRVDEESQSDLTLLGEKFEKIFKSQSSVLAAVGDFNQKMRYLEENVDKYNIEKEFVRLNMSTNEAMEELFASREPPMETVDSARLQMRRGANLDSSMIGKIPSTPRQTTPRNIFEPTDFSPLKNSPPSINGIEMSPFRHSKKTFTDCSNYLRPISSRLDPEPIESEDPKKISVFLNGVKVRDLSDSKMDRFRKVMWKAVRYVKALQLFKMENLKNEDLQMRLCEAEGKLSTIMEEMSELRRRVEESDDLLEKIKKRFAIDLEQLKNMGDLPMDETEDNTFKHSNLEEEENTINFEKEEAQDFMEEEKEEGEMEDLDPNEINLDKVGKKRMKVQRANPSKPQTYIGSKMFQDDKNALALLEKSKHKKLTKNIHLFPQKLVLKQISNIYRERFHLTRDKSEYKDQNLASFVYNIFRNQYGTTKFLDQKFIIFILSLRKNQHLLRVSTFAKFFQIFNEGGNYSLDEFNKYMEGYEFFQTSNFGVTVPNGETDQNHFVPFLRAMDYFKYFSDKKMSQEEVFKLRTEIQKMKEKDPSGANSFGIINMDCFLIKILGLYKEMVQKTKLYVESAFNAADLDGNGYIEPEEFMILWKHLNPDRFNFFECDRLFNANCMTMPEGQRGLPFDKFTQICFTDDLFRHESQLAFCKISSMEEVPEVFMELRDSWPSLKEKLLQRLDNCDMLDETKGVWWKEVINRIEKKIPDCQPSFYLSFIIGINIVEKETKELFGTYIENKHS